MQTIPFDAASASQREQAAAILVSALAHVPSAWHDMPSAREEVASFITDPDRMAIAALDGMDVVGWIGRICHSRTAWELHPLAIHPSHQGRGFGTGLVTLLEDEARRAGVCTIWLGTDDDFGGTNLFDIDLYPDVLEHLRRLAPAGRRPLSGRHPYTFYRRLGYTVVGVLPDVDGFGRHDILMAKRI
ncbi:MAG: GNAT family N-acetyltransferase [Xanthobacteraceae bacterium]